MNKVRKCAMSKCLHWAKDDSGFAVPNHCSRFKNTNGCIISTGRQIVPFTLQDIIDADPCEPEFKNLMDFRTRNGISRWTSVEEVMRNPVLSRNIWWLLYSNVLRPKPWKGCTVRVNSPHDAQCLGIRVGDTTTVLGVPGDPEYDKLGFSPENPCLPGIILATNGKGDFSDREWYWTYQREVTVVTEEG